MVVKCPNCGQPVKGYPGQSGPCPKCGQRFSFPKENKNAGAFVTCPHCGQMQLLQADEKCIKCRSTIYVYDKSMGKRVLGPLYVCPECGHVQSGDSEYCENCRSKMARKSGLSKLFVAVFGIAFLFFVFNFIMRIYRIVAENSYVGSLEGESLMAHLDSVYRRNVVQ